MVILQKSKDDNKHVLIVDVAADKSQWKNVLNKLVAKYSKIGNAKGFRKGHIPFNVALQRIKQSNAYAYGVNEICNITYKQLIESDAIANQNLIEDVPNINVLKINDQEVTIRYTFDLLPNVIVGDYKKALEGYIKPTVTPLEIENQVTMFLNKYGATAQKINIVGNNSSIKIDYEGKIDNKPFPGSSATNYRLKIGSHEFLPGFEEKLIGLQPNSEITFDLKIPADYYLEEFQNKTVTYTVKVKEIISNDIVLNDESVKMFNIKNVHTVSQFKEFLKNKVLIEKSKVQIQQAQEKLISIFKNETKLDFIPEATFERQRAILLSQYSQYAKSKNISLQILVANDKSLITMDNFYKFIDKKAIENINMLFAIDKLTDELKIQLSEDDDKLILNALSNKYNLPAEVVKTKYADEYSLSQTQLIQKKLIEKIIIDSK